MYIFLQFGKIAHELDFVNYHVRTELDELKRTELERLRHLATQRFEMENDLDMDHLKMAEHVDHSNPHTFEVNDLKKLIAKVLDLEMSDSTNYIYTLQQFVNILYNFFIDYRRPG